MTVAIIYDTNTAYTTGVYFHRSFQELGFNVDAYHQDHIKNIPDTYDIYFIVDSGPTYDIPTWTGLSIYYAIDTHLDFDNRFEMAKKANIAAMAQMSCGAQKSANRGLPALWAPLGCDPWIHQDYQVERDLDIAFVGNIYEDDIWRTTIKAKLLEHGYQEEKIFIGKATKEEMAHIYSRAKIVLNNTVRDNKQDINMRVFEAMSSGAYLITQKLDNDDIKQLFPEDVFGAYKTEEEMFTLIEAALKDYEKYAVIAQSAKLLVRAQHTYTGRVKSLVSEAMKKVAENANNDK